MSPETQRLSVITTAYNNERHLAAAIESILSQECEDFEYLLVDDASTDGSAEIIARYAAQDRRIRPIRNETNLNPTGALNRGLSLARGEYVAILDADDLAYPERLGRQAAFLDEHPGISVVGAQVQQIGPDGHFIRLLAYPTEPGLARWQVFFQIPVLHSAAMMRRNPVVQVGGYSAQRWRVNDYDLFARLMRTSGVTNLPECLAAYRVNPDQLSSTIPTAMQGQAILLIYSLLVERLGLRIGLPDLNLLYTAVRAQRMPDETALLCVSESLGAIYRRFVEVEMLEGKTMELTRQDCAWHGLVMALVHRRIYPQAARQVLRLSLEIDPELFQRRETWQRLRRWRTPRSSQVR